MVFFFVTMLLAIGMGLVCMAASMNVAQAATDEAAIVGAAASVDLATGDVQQAQSTGTVTIALPSSGSSDINQQAATAATTLFGGVLHLFGAPSLSFNRQIVQDGGYRSGTYTVTFTGQLFPVVRLAGFGPWTITLSSVQRYRPVQSGAVS
ncbi:MAG: hypothetical protein ACYDAG_12595 [Chloroflexota bacterium]